MTAHNAEPRPARHPMAAVIRGTPVAFQLGEQADRIGRRPTTLGAWILGGSWKE